jgi:hypothetical protein
MRQTYQPVPTQKEFLMETLLHVVLKRYDYRLKGEIYIFFSNNIQDSIFCSASVHEVVERSSQIFDVNHLKECIDIAHICPGGRLELIIDSGKSFGLFHKNGLKCSICNKITDLTNFPAQSSRQIQEPNQRLYAASAISGTGYDTTQFVLALLGISMPHRSTFYQQVHNL